MSDDIDMKSLTGADFGSAAGDQQHAVDTNSYLNEASDYPVYEVPDQLSQLTEEPNIQASNPQRDHFRALQDKVDLMQAEREKEHKDYQLQLDMLRANMPPRQPIENTQQKETKFFDGMSDDDIPSVGEFRREMEQREAVYQARIEELQVAQMYPDYAEVIEKHALPLVKQKPHLAEGIQGARNKALFAYELGKMAQQMQQNIVSTPKSEVAQKIVENSRKPGTLSQAGGQGALSQADYFATMSDQEFMRFATRNLERI